ncbi:hypothetical protein [Pontiella agarivorans]|uniref:DUF1425 domain-containing protein n=1 Tax=Pontiella agarivorans TaxID=3038953 RepID=A0ABU5MWY0_9BACT|nr:hypothetical protein [Pontiella agarivorans]MDZ8118652.1 hypothetical protein [Pontiella agarivorans]
MNTYGFSFSRRGMGRWALMGLAAPLLFLMGCSSPEMQIVGGGFRNLTDFPIKDVELRVIETHQVVSCSYIAARGFFSTLIPVRAYEQNEVEVSWNYNGSILKSGPFKVEVPDPVPTEPVVAVIRFHPTGRVSAVFVPKSAIPREYLAR